MFGLGIDVGQTVSLLKDVDVSPAAIDYWGPSRMRSVTQFMWPAGPHCVGA